jgi:hypothetical protein
MKALPVTLSIAALIVLSGYNCNDVLKDPGFDLWCGDTLCAWDLEAGTLRRVPTWHRSDTGVELIGAEVAISQFSPRTSSDLRCLRFELIADVEETASVTLELDFFADGVVDHQQVIPTSHWAELSYRINLPTLYQGILFRIRKRGSGRAVLAEIAALAESDCGDLPAIAAASRPSGAWCLPGDPDTACTAGSCAGLPGWTSVCGACADSSECEAGEVCGLSSTAPAFLELHRACVPVASRGLGERCQGDAECGTGACVSGVCSSCGEQAECPAEQECRRRGYTPEGLPWPMSPFQCEPGAGMAAAGAVCLTGSDCQSGVCNGSAERRLCLSDSRACERDSDCPPLESGSSGDAGTCVTVGAVDGICE